MGEHKKIRVFNARLYRHAILKAKLFDGIHANMSVEAALRRATEELGEVAAAITRHRYNSVKDECIDLAHCAMLIVFAVNRLHRKDA